MKINAKYRLHLRVARQAIYRSTPKYIFCIMDEYPFIALIFTLWASLSATPQQVGRAGGFHLLCYSGRSID
jgi:hypothetical protein